MMLNSLYRAIGAPLRLAASYVARHGHPRCASRWASEGVVEERIHRLDNGVPIGLFGHQQQATANEGLDFTIAEIELVATKAVAATLSAPAHKMWRLSTVGPNSSTIGCPHWPPTSSPARSK